MNQALSNKIADMQEEILEGIGGAIQIDSVMGPAQPGAPFGPGPRKALDYALDLAQKMGFQTGNVDDQVGYAEWGSGDEMIAVLGHLDVVPVDGTWSFDPFLGQVVDGALCGRGSVDDKGMAIGALYALQAIRDLGLKTDRRIRVLFGTNEENGSACVKHYVTSGQELPVMGITPDAEYPLIFFEKGMTDAIIGTPSFQQGAIPVLHFSAGTAFNVVPDRAELVLAGRHELTASEDLTVEYEGAQTRIVAKGASAHGSMPQKGKNAIVRLMEAVQTLGIGGDFDRLCRMIIEKIGKDTQGKQLGVYYQDDETGETTVNLGMARLEKDQLFFTLDIRYPKNGRHEEVEKALREGAEAYGLTLLDRRPTDPLYVEQDSELVVRLLKVYREMTGDQRPPLAIGGGTYAKEIPNMVAFGPMFPGDPQVEHQPDEKIAVDKLMKAITITAQAMLALAQA